MKSNSIILSEMTPEDLSLLVGNVFDHKMTNFVSEFSSQSQSDAPLFIDGCESLTGFAKATIYAYCQKNLMPHHKKNGKLFFFKSELIDWIKEGKQKTLKEIEADADAFLSNNKRKSSNGRK